MRTFGPKINSGFSQRGYLSEVDHFAARCESFGFVCFHLFHALLNALARGGDLNNRHNTFNSISASAIQNFSYLFHVGLRSQLHLQQQMPNLAVLLAELVVVTVLQRVPLLRARIQILRKL